MKIAFVTSCLAPGKDGVGDYTRLLAEACVQQGHQCRLIALHDGFTYGARTTDSTAGPTMQFGRNVPWATRVAVGRAFLRDFDPDWVSLQFVNYGFDRRGLPVRVPQHFRQLFRGFPVHLMLHELWVGAQRDATLRHRVVGRMQKFLMRRLIRSLSPAVVHTSNRAYVSLLQSLDVRATRLPMFGAIPVQPEESDAWCLGRLQENGVRLTQQNRSTFWLLGIFGALHPIWPPEPLFSRLQQIASVNGKKLVVVSVGRLGSGEALWDKCAATYAGRIHFCRLGEQSPLKLAGFFKAIDFGLATTPATLIGKSASVAAMLDHGVPVIVNRDDVQFAGISDDSVDAEPLLIRLDGRFTESLQQARRQPPRERLPDVVRTFLESLTHKAYEKRGPIGTTVPRTPHPYPLPIRCT